MATITKIFDNKIDQKRQAELDAMENASVNRAYFLEKQIYGGNNATVKGTWKAAIIKIVINKDNEITEKRVWAVGFMPEGTDKPIADLTKSFLLNRGRYDKNDNHITAKGDVRQWADKNIIHGILEKEWCVALAVELNNRGLCMVNEHYQCGRKDGGSFTAVIQHPYFADTFGK